MYVDQITVGGMFVGGCALTRNSSLHQQQITEEGVRISTASYFAVAIQRRIELLDDPELLRQLGNLRQEKTERGLIDVRPCPGVNDDLAVAVALGASELCKQVPDPMPMPFEIIDNNPLGLIPSSCSYAGGCQNSTRCLDEDYCIAFKMLDSAFFSGKKQGLN